MSSSKITNTKSKQKKIYNQLEKQRNKIFDEKLESKETKLDQITEIKSSTKKSNTKFKVKVGSKLNSKSNSKLNENATNKRSSYNHEKLSDVKKKRKNSNFSHKKRFENIVQGTYLTGKKQVYNKLEERGEDDISADTIHKTLKGYDNSVRAGKFVKKKSTSFKDKLTSTRRNEGRKVLRQDSGIKSKIRHNSVGGVSNATKKVNYQKMAIKKMYARKFGEKSIGTLIKETLKKALEIVGKAIMQLLKNPKVLAIVVAVSVVVALVLSLLTSTMFFLQNGVTTVVSTSYTSEEEDLIATDEAYTHLENALQVQIDNVEINYPSYNEYIYDLDEINHNPHDLAAYLTALLQFYTYEDVEDMLPDILSMQYKLTMTRTWETRYKTETVTDENGEETTIRVPYIYNVLNIKLENLGMDYVASQTLDEEQYEMYLVYKETLGNRELVFGGGSADITPSTDLSGVVFVDGERLGNQNIVDIALTQVGNIGGEPYWSWYGFTSRVEWCATFVSWVLNQAGYNEPKYASCNAQGVVYFYNAGRWADKGYEHITAGDVIFFDWNGDGKAQHTGIVIGRDEERVYTVEGNSNDVCKIKDYSLNSSVILGYGLMN